MLSQATQMRPSFSYTAICLSYQVCPIRPFGHLPLEEKADDARIALAHTAFGHRHYFCSAALRETLILRLNQRFPRSFDSVLLFQISHNIRRFSPLRMTKCAALPP